MSEGLPKLTSYQVIGVTNPREHFEWEFGRCSDQGRCWGTAQRLLDIRRSGDEYMIANVKIADGIHEEIVDKFFVRMNRRYREFPKNSYYYEGIAFKSKLPKFGWPKLVDDVEVGKGFFIHVSMIQKPIPPEDILGKPRADWPTGYSTSSYINAMIVRIEHFWCKSSVEDFPSCRQDLEELYPLSLTIMEIYPGGGGMRMLQFKYVTHSTDLVLRPVISPANILALYTEIDSIKDISDFIKPEKMFIFGLQDGYSGPIISFYSRIHHNN